MFSLLISGGPFMIILIIFAIIIGFVAIKNFIITKGDWWMGMGAFGFSMQSALLIRDKFFSITKNKDNNETRN